MRFKIKNALIGGAIYIFFLGIVAAISINLLFLFIFYGGVCVAISRKFILDAETRRSNSVVEFSQFWKVESIGSQYGSFHHTFCSTESVIDGYRQALDGAIKTKIGGSNIHEVVFKDMDRDLFLPENRTFFLTSLDETVRKSGFFLLCYFTRSSNVQVVRWWVLVSGPRDPNKVFWRYLFSPLSLPFFILPYFYRQHDPLNGLATIDPGFFNGIDVLNRTREIQFIAFETLVDVLESFKIDTADLKQQKGNILNVNVSGGQNSFGSIVQGAMNKIASVVGVKEI